MWNRLMAKFLRRGFGFSRGSTKRKQVEWIRLQIGWLLRAVVRADGIVTKEEQALLQRFLGERFGPEYSQEGPFGGHPPELEPGDLKSLASELAGSLSHSECETVLEWCCQLAASDGRVTQVEVVSLEPIARGLGIAQRDLLRLLARERRTVEIELDKPPVPCEVLGLAHGATQAEIAARYRQLVLEFHPDRHQHLGAQAAREAEARFLEIRKAYEELRKRG